MEITLPGAPESSSHRRTACRELPEWICRLSRGWKQIGSSPPNEQEIAEVIKTLKNGKAPGSNNITAVLLKAEPIIIAHYIRPLIIETWQNEYIPEVRKRGLTVKIPKKDNFDDRENWRGINLTAVPSKTLRRIVFGRISDIVDGKFRKVQSGFRSRRSCTVQNHCRKVLRISSDPISSIHRLWEGLRLPRWEKNWEAMKSFGIPCKIINIVKILSKNSTCQVIYCGRLSELINI